MYALFTQVCTMAAGLGVYQAAQWINEGYGLNPLLALPIATLLFVLPYNAQLRAIYNQPRSKQ